VNRKDRRAQGKTAGNKPPVAMAAAGLAGAPLNDRAIALHGAGHTTEAIPLLQQAVALNPGHPPFHNNLGELLRLNGQTEAAMAALDRALSLRPDYAEAHSNRGNLLRQIGRPAEAVAAYEAALALKPDFADAWSNLATAQMDQSNFPAAVAALNRAIALKPQAAFYRKNLGLALLGSGDYDGADAAFAAMDGAALKLQTGLDVAMARGDLARARGDLDAALRWYEHAWRLQPGHGEAHMRYGTALMVKGDYRAAWPHFGARWSMADTAADKRPFTLPFWKGEALPAGGRMLLFTEQGVGESLVLWSLLPELFTRGITPVIECDPRMIPILARSFPDLELHARTNPPHARLLEPDLVVQATLFDLAAVFRSSPADCTGTLPIRADMARAAAIRTRYQDGDPRPLIGVAWHSGNVKLGAPKSAKLTDLAPLLSLPGYRFVDLQYGNRADDRAALKTACGTDLLYDTEIDQLKDLDAFAAQVAALDMVISTSNTTAHMAAALGKPTWLLLHKGISPHWYWTLDAATTPWYPTARLFRQPARNDWRGLAKIVAAELPRTLPSATS
jgi:tetratricopeptide (TPR) repeat protein